MWIIPVVLCLLALTPEEGGGTKTSPTTDAESRMILKNELNKVAYDFQAKMEEELTRLDSEMYSEFSEFISEMSVSQEAVSKTLKMKLSEQVAEMLEKFTKVMTYSTFKIQDLSNRLSGILTSLGTWTDDLDSIILFSHDEYLTATLYNVEDADSERNRRHTLDWASRVPPELHYINNISSSDLLGLPLVQEVDLDAFLDHSNDLVGQVREESSLFALRDYTPVWRSSAAPHGSHHTAKDATKMPRDCLDLLTAGHTENGVYKIYPAGVGVEVWCDQSSAGGGWTVVSGRRAATPHFNFTRPALHYTHGFGDPLTNHWIGVEVMHAITRHARNALRVHLIDHELHNAHATYSTFSVAGSDDNYRLQVGGYDPSSTAGDALIPHSGANFSSPDPFSGNKCSGDLGVGWWFLEDMECYLTLPTGHYRTAGRYQGSGGLEWQPWRGAGYSLHTLLLMTRRHTV